MGEVHIYLGSNVSLADLKPSYLLILGVYITYTSKGSGSTLPQVLVPNGRISFLTSSFNWGYLGTLTATYGLSNSYSFHI